jgi:hypothetical protein
MPLAAWRPHLNLFGIFLIGTLCMVLTAKKKKGLYIVLGILAFFLIIRLILPYVLLHYANKALANLHGYYGQIRDLDLALYRGAYKVKHIYLHKKDTVTGEQTEFFDCPLVDLSVHWRALMKGKIAGELEFEDPTLRFVKEKVEPKQVVRDSSDFRKMLDNFMPLDVNRFEIKNGVVKYIDQFSNPAVDIYMHSVNIRAENLTNVQSEAVLPSTVVASANIYGGTLDFSMRLDPLANDPTFDMDAELRNTYLPQLNNFFKAYGKFDVSRGNFGLFAEAAASNGEFVGYVKPVIKDLKVIGPEDKNDPLYQKFWENIVGGAGLIFRNYRHNQVATKIPMKGTFNNTRVGIITGVLEILRNAFIQALRPSIDEEINIHTVSAENPARKGPLKDLFESKDKKDEGSQEKTEDEKSKKELRKEKREERREKQHGKQEENKKD